MMTSTERALTLAVATALAASPAAAQHGAPRPHIVFSMVDDLGWANVGWHNKDVLTPRSEALIAEGIQLDRHLPVLQSLSEQSDVRSLAIPRQPDQPPRLLCRFGRCTQYDNDTKKAQAGGIFDSHDR